MEVWTRNSCTLFICFIKLNAIKFCLCDAETRGLRLPVFPASGRPPYKSRLCLLELWQEMMFRGHHHRRRRVSETWKSSRSTSLAFWHDLLCRHQASASHRRAESQRPFSVILLWDCRHTIGDWQIPPPHVPGYTHTYREASRCPDYDFCFVVSPWCFSFIGYFHLEGG